MSRRALRGSFPGATSNSQTGCYGLVIGLSKCKKIRVGRLGVGIFPKGTYIYTGSAMNGLGARLRRHLRFTKKLHWHIDYLLALDEAKVKKIIVYPPQRNQECRQNQRIAKLPGAGIVVKRFGATDCRLGCASHLIYFASEAQAKCAGGEAIALHSI